MRRSLHLALLIVLFLWPAVIQAQESTSRQVYNQAESEYEIGRIEQAIQLLHDHLDGFEGNLRQSAYRLLALCYLSEDRDAEARYYAEQLVRMNNYYNSAEDPARFQDLISQLKEGITTTITTASSQSESINEAPGPITIITSEMIEELGNNKNLAQILASYVPGMAEVASVEESVNLSMHGAYANGQELILIMENGHRLNSRLDNSGPVSYSVSTDKIDHIEVLRGPASSLYGNVALSAVVNVITKSGRKIDGLKAKYGYGTNNTHRLDFSAGTQFMDVDIFGWASVYQSDGEIRRFDEGEAYMKDYYNRTVSYSLSTDHYIGPNRIYVDGYKDTPSYDVGMMLRLKGFDLMFSKKNVKKIMQHTVSLGGYDYDGFNTFQDIKPGYATESTHAEIGYTRQLGKFYLNASLYGDWYVTASYDVQYDSLMSTSPLMDENYEIMYDDRGNMLLDVTEECGVFRYYRYKEQTMGGIVKASTDYQFGRMKGNVLAGAQYERFSLQSVMNIWGKKIGDLDSGLIDYRDMVESGKEKSLSFFIQDKHYFRQHFILNTGFRYDFKYRHKEDVVRTLSPRLALLYIPHERFSLKLSYSEAFADLSFSNRYVTKIENITMDPQHLSAVQLTAMGVVPSMHLNYEANLFYNRYSNLLCWDIRNAEYTGKNSGQLTNIGFEGTASYAFKRLSAIFSLYYCKDLSSKSYYYNDSKNMVCGVPHFMLNLHGAWKLLQWKDHELKIYGHSKYIGKKLNFSTEEEEDFFVDGNFLIDLGIKYRYGSRLQFSVDCENLFDTDTYICGYNYQYLPHFQRGRTVMASLALQF